MASIPNTSAGLIKLGQFNVSGMQAYATTLDIKLITTAQCEANLADFIAKDGTYNAARAAQQTASDSHQAALAPIYPWVLGVSNTLATRFGTRWNTEWAQAGFTNYTTAIPAKIEDQLALVVSLVSYFTANPSAEVPSLNQTAAYGTSLRSAYLSTQTALAAAQITFNNEGTAWTTSYTTLTDGMRALADNLANVLSSSDPRWLAFGFNIPSAPSTPAKVQNVTAHMDGTGAVVVQCDATALATRYRARTMIVGQQTSYVLSGSGTEPLLSLDGFLPGQTLQIIMQAVNGNLQGVASDPIRFTLPLLMTRTEAAATTTPAATLRDEVVISSNGNGANGNGHRMPALS